MASAAPETSKVAAWAKMMTWISGGTTSTMRDFGSFQSEESSLRMRARMRRNIGQSSLRRVTARVAATATVAEMASAARLGSSTALTEPARNRVCRIETR